MKITIEKVEYSTSLIYIELGSICDVRKTITEVLCELLSDNYGNWVGINIFNKTIDAENFVLPKVKNISNAEIVQNEKSLTILFNSVYDIYNIRKSTCNIDYNETELSGIEIIISNFNYKVDIIKRYTTFRTMT